MAQAAVFLSESDFRRLELEVSKLVSEEVHLLQGRYGIYVEILLPGGDYGAISLKKFLGQRGKSLGGEWGNLIPG